MHYEAGHKGDAAAATESSVARDLEQGIGHMGKLMDVGVGVDNVGPIT